MRATVLIPLVCLSIIRCAGQDPDYDEFEPQLFEEAGITANLISFNREEDLMIVSGYVEDYGKQALYFSEFNNGKWADLKPLDFATSVYNGSLSGDGSFIVFSKEIEDENGFRYEVNMVEKTGSGWSAPQNLTSLYDIQGGYFEILENRNMYYYRYDAASGSGGIYFSQWNEDRYLPAVKLPDVINRYEPFGPYVNPEENLIIFTQYVDGNKDLTGLFVSRKVNGDWQEPKKLELLPYGWGITLSSDIQYLLIHEGDTFKYRKYKVSEIGLSLD